MESLLKDSIVELLEKNNLINNSHHGFRNSRLCLSNLLTFLDRVTMDIEDRNCVDVIYSDFAKAFDKVLHQRLLNKLKSGGIKGKLWTWTSAWLTGRQQRVCILYTILPYSGLGQTHFSYPTLAYLANIHSQI